MDTPTILITGFSGSGKTTLFDNIMALHGDQLHRVISTTTRSLREGEVDGVHYHFITPEQFIANREAGKFLESSQHYGHYYGSTAPEFVDVPEGKIPLYLLDPKGVKFFVQKYPESKPFFLYISRDEQIKRLGGRNHEQHLVDERLKRYDFEHEILKDQEHLLHVLPHETVDDLNNAVEYIRRTLQLG
ncbi:guanylate kinase [soil metagenome]